MEAAAARLSLRLAYVPVELVADDLEHDKLIRVLQRYSLRMERLFLYYPHRNVSPALRMVIDTLKICSLAMTASSQCKIVSGVPKLSIPRSAVSDERT